MTDSIKITSLNSIGANIAYTTLIPVVNMAGTPVTQKATAQLLGNLILEGAGGSYFPQAAQATLAQTVTNAAQPNITSVGTLTSLAVIGNITAGNVNGGNIVVANFYYGDGGFLTNVSSGYSNSNVAAYLPTYTGNVGAGNVNVTGTVYANGISSTGLASLTTLNVSATANLGAVANVRISGGSAGQVLTTNGNSGLSWTTVSGGSSTGNITFTGSNISTNVASADINVIGSASGNVALISNNHILMTVADTVDPHGGIEMVWSNSAAGVDKYVGISLNTAVGNLELALGNVQITAFNSTEATDIANATWTFGTNGTLLWPGAGSKYLGNGVGSQFEIHSDANVVIGTDIGNSDRLFVFDQSGDFLAPGNVALEGTSVLIGPGASALGLADATLVISSTSNAYLQAVINNVSDIGSADWVAQGHYGDDTSGWADLGFTSASYFDDANSMFGPGTGYVIVNGYLEGQAPALGTGSLILSTGEGGSEKDIIFGTGGSLASNIFGRISNANNALELTRANGNLKLTGGGGIFGSGNLDIFAGGTAQVGSSLVIETGSAYGDTAVSIASDPTLVTTYPAGSTITFQDGDVRTITAYDNYPGGTDIFWDTSKTGTLFPITLKTSDYAPAYLGTAVNVSVGGNIWTFDNTGNFSLPDGTQMGPIEGANTFGFYNANASTEFLIEMGPSNAWGFVGNTGGTIFPQLSVQRGDNPSGTITGQTLLFGDNTQEAIISTPDGVDDFNSSSQRLVINPGKGADGTVGEGGDIYLWAGRGGSGSGSGGDIKIRGGQGGANTDGGLGGGGGYIRIEAGDASGTGAPGYVDINGGNSATIGGGYVEILGGQGATVGGDANLKGGYGFDDRGGNVNIWGGGSGNGQINEGNVNIQTGGNTWTFDPSGNLTLPAGGIVHETSIPGGILSGNTIALKPSGGTNADQQLLVYPTAIGSDFNHLHMTSGNLYNTELFLGNDDFYVKLANTGNVVINSNDSIGNVGTWTFDIDGNLVLPQLTTISDESGIGTTLTVGVPPTVIVISGADFSAVNTTYTKTSAATPTWEPAGYNPATDPYIEFSGGEYGIFAPSFGQALYVNTGTLNKPLTQWNTNPPLGSVAPTAVYTYGAPGPDWVFGADGNLTLPGNTVAINFANGSSAFGNIVSTNLDGNVSNVLTGNGTFAAIPAPTVSQDIASSGAMSIMTYDGNLKYVSYATVEPSSGNIAGGNISTTGIVTANTANITTGNITTINSGLLQNGNSNITITSNGNVSIQSAGSNVELVVTSTGANVTGTFNATGTVTGGNLSTAGTITANGGSYGEVVTTQFASVWGSGGGPNPYSIMQVRSSDGVSGLGMQAFTGSGTLYGNTAINFGLATIRDKDVPSGLVVKAYIDSTGLNVTGIANISGDITGSNISTAGIVKTGVFNTSNIPAAATAGAGARAFVTDADSTTFKAAYVGGSGNAVPVFSDGSAWYVG